MKFRTQYFLPLFVFLFLGIVTSTQAQTQDTLVAFYPFSGSAADASGFENNGDVYGATLTADRFGNENSAYEFDGIDDYLVIKDDDLLTPVDQQMTISLWFKTKYPGGRFLLYKGSNQYNREYAMAVRADSLASFQINHQGDWQERSHVESTKIIEEDVWNHLVGIWNENRLEIYINGKLENVVDTNHVIGNHDSDLYIGKYGGSINEDAFYGSIDDIRIYNYALDTLTIQDLYTEGDWPLAVDSTNTMVAFYPFSGSAADASGFENNGDVYGATLTADRFGNENSAYEFDGIDDYLVIKDDDLLTPVDQQMTISLWFKTKYPGGRFLLYKGSNQYNREYAMAVRADSLASFQINHLGNWLERSHVESTIIQEEVWNHLVGIWNENRLEIYINGKLENVVDTNHVIGNYDSDLYIGRYGGSINEDAFKGSIDDIRIYNHALDTLVIQHLYTEGDWPLALDSTDVPNDTLVAYYPFNGNALDESGYENHGEVIGATLTTDRFGNVDKAYSFDGIDDHIVIYNPKDLHYAKNLSLSFWSKGSGADTSFAGLITAPNMQPFGVGIDDGDRMLISISSDNIPLNLVTTGLNDGVNEWSHYVAVYRANEFLKLFKNGKEISALYGTIPGFMDTDLTEVYIGALPVTTQDMQETFYFTGSIDDIRFYNYALNSDSVVTLYEKENSTTVSNERELFLPEEYTLYQNYPNPFNPQTNISFDIPQSGKVSLKVYDINGRLVASLVDGIKSAGTYRVSFDASHLASGIYLYALRTSSYTSVKKLTLIK